MVESLLNGPLGIEVRAGISCMLYVLRGATSLAAAMKYAVALGGDTDTAAAIVGGILGCQLKDIESAIPWLPRVVLPTAEIVEATAAGLCGLRQSPHVYATASTVHLGAP
jgi:ADP-ribosyl-[dinitrogen reductase] hydrolase